MQHLMLIGGTVAYLMYLRSGVIKKLGVFGRFAVVMAGCCLFGLAFGLYNPIPGLLSDAIAGGVCCLVSVLSMPWIFGSLWGGPEQANVEPDDATEN